MSNIMNPTVPAETVETAMALWEAAFRLTDTHPDLRAVRRAIGTTEFRRQFANVRLLAVCEAAFEIAQDEGFDDDFARDWCPIFVRTMLNVDVEKNTISPTVAWHSHAKFIASAHAVGLPVVSDGERNVCH